LEAKLLLKSCNLDSCQAACCYDGVYLTDYEEEIIKKVVSMAPDIFSDLPEKYIVDGSWMEHQGRKTAIKDYCYTSITFPKHFNQTRCVFCNDKHLCLLQIYAIQNNLHKWTFKPMSCWLFPLTLKKGDLSPPPLFGEPDPNNIGPEYPGYVTYTTCGKHNEEGSDWREVLKEEIEHYNEFFRDKLYD
jgi:hypothetical protein